MSNYKLPFLPLTEEIETKAVLKKLVLAHKALAELNGVSETMLTLGKRLSVVPLITKKGDRISLCTK